MNNTWSNWQMHHSLLSQLANKQVYEYATCTFMKLLICMFVLTILTQPFGCPQQEYQQEQYREANKEEDGCPNSTSHSNCQCGGH